MNHLLTAYRVVIVVIAPLAESHLLAHQVHPNPGTLRQRNILAPVMNRDGRLIPVFTPPDDFLRSERCITADENARACALHRVLVNDGNLPLIKFDAEIALNPGE